MSQVVSNVMMEIFNPPLSADVRAAADSVVVVSRRPPPWGPLSPTFSPTANGVKDWGEAASADCRTDCKWLLLPAWQVLHPIQKPQNIDEHRCI